MRRWYFVLAISGWALASQGCSTPESVHLFRGTGGRSPTDGGRSGGAIGSGGAPIFGTGGAPGTGGIFTSGGAIGSGGAPTFGTGGAVNTGGGGPVTTGGRQGSGGAVGAGGATGSGGGVGTGGRGNPGSGGASETGGRGGPATGGRSGGGGVAGGNCIMTLVEADYAAGGQSCAECRENSMSLQDKCMAMVNCLVPVWPCSSSANCWTQCLNMVGGSGPLATCVTALTAAACGN